MKHFFIAVLTACSFMLCSSAYAGNTDETSNTKSSQSVLKEIAEKAPKLSGYLQTGWNYSTAGDGTSSFQAKRLRLIADGEVTPKLAFRLQLEAFNGISGSTNGNGQKNIQVMDAFATYSFSSAFKVRAGQYFLPLGYENYNISPATLETVDFSNICYRMVCRNPYEYDFVDYGRDLGVMIMGDLFLSQKGFHYMSYDLSVTNGSLPSKDDSNKSKDIVAALTFRPMEYLNFKASYAWSESSHKDAEGIKTPYNTMNRVILGAWYNNPTGFDLRAEYGYLKGEKSAYDERGFYALAGYHFQTNCGEILPVIRYDRYEDKVNTVSPNNYDRILAAITYQPASRFKLQLNYQHAFYLSDAKKAIGDSGYDQIQLMGIFKF